MKIDVLDLSGAKVGQVDLDDGVFGAEVKEHLLWEIVKAQRASRRAGTHSTKTQDEVSGGGKKPWRQKGTGRARQGSTRAPHWRHGGVVFGPHPRDYRLGIPKKVRQIAKKSALNARAREGALVVVDALAYEKPKTKPLAELLGKLGLEDKKVLVLTADSPAAHNIYLSGRNIEGVRVQRFADATAYDVLWCNAVVVEAPALSGAESEPADETAEGGDDA
jgi:large subunit ribosomal protein L4